MKIQNCTSKWICECLVENPLHLKQCSGCGKRIPESVLKQVYQEEVRIQNVYFRNRRLERSAIRCKKSGMIMQKMRGVVVPIAFAVVIMVIGGRYWLFPQEMKDALEQYQLSRVEKLSSDSFYARERLIKLKSTQIVIRSAGLDVRDTIVEKATQLSQTDKKSSMKLNQKKVMKMKHKIRKVVDYVTGKFKQLFDRYINSRGIFGNFVELDIFMGDSARNLYNRF